MAKATWHGIDFFGTDEELVGIARGLALAESPASVGAPGGPVVKRNGNGNGTPPSVVVAAAAPQTAPVSPVSPYKDPVSVEDITAHWEAGGKDDIMDTIIHFTGAPMPTRIVNHHGKAVTNPAYNKWVHRVMRARVASGRMPPRAPRQTGRVQEAAR